MSKRGSQGPNLGATFCPGGTDEYLMPELVMPSPQRTLPAIPTNIQQGLAQLELEARESRGQGPVSPISSFIDDYGDSPTIARPRGELSLKPQPPLPVPRGYTAEYGNTNAATYQNAFDISPVEQSRQYATTKAREPSGVLSRSFPKPKNPGANVPPSDDEKEEVLERARPVVLSSSDAELQLAWAQDALSWVEISASYRARITDSRVVRSSTPVIEHQLKVDAMSIINFLADQQHPKALLLKGLWYEFGRFGYRVDLKEAIHTYAMAAEKGLARAEYRLGHIYENSHDTKSAMQHYRKGADQGDPASNHRLGMIALQGQLGMQQDYREGLARVHLAADTADESAAQGAYVYGMLLAGELPSIPIPDGILPIDLEQARQYVEKAAYLGIAKAQEKMGQAYHLCLFGCDFDPLLSLHYHALAARQGNLEAEFALSTWFLTGYSGLFDKSEELAFLYADQAARGGLVTAEVALGYFNEIGIFVPCNLQEAHRWYAKAAESGNLDAKERLRALSNKETLTRNDHDAMAITRIKSKYGSMKGRRPDRHNKALLQMPQMMEENTAAPILANHGRKSSESGRLGTQNSGLRLSRPSSVTPYPEDDDAPHRGRGRRSGSATIRSNMLGIYADQPDPAFGVDMLSTSVPTNRYPATAPVSSTPEISRASGEAKSRSRHGSMSSAWEAQRPRSNRNTRESTVHPSMDTIHKPPNQDLSPGRSQLPVQRQYNSESTRPLLPVVIPASPQILQVGDLSMMYSARQDSLQPRHSNVRQSSPSPDSRRRHPSSDGSQSSLGPSSSSPDRRLRHPSQESSPQRHHIGGHAARQPSPQRNTQASPNPLHARRPSVPMAAESRMSATGNVPSPRPARGPQTFEDMGIPEQKSESECVMM